jgi:uncharacterized membrane protein YphA (DoxX/SURF4 family)
MSTIASALRPAPLPRPGILRNDPAAQAFTLLRIAFTVAPILFGLDKFAGVLTGDWTRYLASEFNDLIPGTAGDAMHIVGVVEIIVSLLLVGGYGDIALRDFGLLLGALTLSRLASAFPGGAVHDR